MVCLQQLLQHVLTGLLQESPSPLTPVCCAVASKLATTSWGTAIFVATLDQCLYASYRSVWVGVERGLDDRMECGLAIVVVTCRHVQNVKVTAVAWNPTFTDPSVRSTEVQLSALVISYRAL
jgi:hypothetical protein